MRAPRRQSENPLYNAKYMKNAIILHGAPSKEEYYDPKEPSLSNAHWFPWLQSQLIKNDILAYTPDVPFSFDLSWDVWIKEVERFDMSPETTLIGHSTGAGFFIKYLSVHKNIFVDKLILVAPWIDTEHELKTDFFQNFTIDPDLVERTKGITLFHSDNDMDIIKTSVTVLRNTLKSISYKEFHNYGHFCFEDMHTGEFPELLNEILS